MGCLAVGSSDPAASHFLRESARLESVKKVREAGGNGSQQVDERASHRGRERTEDRRYSGRDFENHSGIASE